jgi:hypothetical protein
MVHFRLSRMLTVAAVLFARQAMGYLGGFENQDGYQSDGSLLQDVSTYNAGQYGTNGGGPGGSAVNITPNTGLFTKFDQGDTSPGNGELVVQPGLARTGNGGLVLRSTSFYGDTAGDGADYLYTFDSRDFNGTSPALVTSGVVSVDYWMRPQTSFFETGLATTTSFVNTGGDTLFSIGMLGQGIFDSKPILEWQDAAGWHNTGIIGNSGGWDHIMLSFDLTTGTVSFSYYSSLTGATTVLATDVVAAAPMDSLTGIHFTAQPNTEVNAYDDFTVVSPLLAMVPEPSSFLFVMLGAMQCLGLRRRRR